MPFSRELLRKQSLSSEDVHRAERRPGTSVCFSMDIQGADQSPQQLSPQQSEPFRARAEETREAPADPTCFSMVEAKKVVTIKVTVKAIGNRVLWFTFPHDSTTVAEIEASIRNYLQTLTKQNKRTKINKQLRDYNQFHLFADSRKVNKQEMISWRWTETKSFTFQSVLSVDEKSSRSTFSRITRTFSHTTSASPLSLSAKTTKTTNSNQQILKAEITSCHQRIAVLEQELEDERKENPRRLHHVEPIRTLGKGASGVVKSCYVNGFICAVKEVDLEYVSDIREIDVLESLPPHPNYVQYFCHRRVGTTLQIFLKQYSGTLLDLIREHKKAGERFTPGQIVGILQDIIDGLDFLHRHRVIHRDLKPDNVFIQQLEDGFRCAIGDLDTAKMVSTMEKAKTVIGTPTFIAPEVLESMNETAYTPKVDVFSFGMVLFQLMALESPYREIKKPWQVTKAIVDGVPPRLPELEPPFQPLVELFFKCISQSPADRPKPSRIQRRLKALAKLYDCEELREN